MQKQKIYMLWSLNVLCIPWEESVLFYFAISTVQKIPKKRHLKVLGL